jgi:hypothetical protein
MGSRMRPLRLVQENVDQEKASAAAAAGNRSSWFGWMNKGIPGMPGLPGLPGSGGAPTTPTTSGPSSGFPQSPPPQQGIARAATEGGHA